jgi:uncharacterized protein YjdB
MRILVVLALGAATVTACRTREPTAADSAALGAVCAARGMFVSPTSATLHPGDTLRASAQMSDCGGPVSPLPSRWLSADTTVATVDSISGLIRARSLGTTTIIAAALADRNVKASLLLAVAQ